MKAFGSPIYLYTNNTNTHTHYCHFELLKSIFWSFQNLNFAAEVEHYTRRFAVVNLFFRRFRYETKTNQICGDSDPIDSY